MEYIYRYKDNDYKYLGVGKFKNELGVWIDAVLYEREGHKYMREIKDFFKKFDDVSSPLYTDYEVASSSEPSMQNDLKPKKKNILDTITDTIGTGYEPGEDKNKNQIRVGQVEEATVIKKHKYDK